MNPTEEQQEIVDAFGWGQDLVVQARAGTGKTSTLKMLARSTRERGVYLAYNKAIAAEAARAFPASVTCKTAHAFAFAAVGRQYSHRLSGPRVPARETAKILGIREPVRYADDKAPLAPQQLARLTMETVTRFCYSADDQIGGRHVPRVTGIDDPEGRAILRQVLVPLAQRAWDQDLAQLDGRLKFTHDVYLKLWCLARPQLGADFVMLDEAQDANPAVAALVSGQNAQKIMVGDACQAIYGWRGAVDAMSTFDGQTLNLSQSFRFGHQVAAEANKWLTLLGARPHVSGLPSLPSVVGPVDDAQAVLCRTNAGALARAMGEMDRGRRAALVGGAGDMKRLAEAALTLKQGLGCEHPELFAFRTWAEVQEYVANDSSGSDLKVFVDLIDKYGAAEVMQTCDRLSPEDTADVVISTAHKAKGREWDSVLIADDFREPRDDEDGLPGEVTRGDAMLAYVAVTRAKLRLDRTGLRWVDRHVSWREVGRPELDRRSLEERGAVVLAGLDDAGVTGMPEEQADWNLDDVDPCPYPVGSTVLYGDAEVTVLATEAAEAVPGWRLRLDLADRPTWVHSNTVSPAAAELEETPPTPARCPRCGSTTCTCDPAALARWLQITSPKEVIRV